MPDFKRPTIGLNCDRNPIDAFVRELQDAIDNGDADHFNLHFAEDVLWGSPFGAAAVGYEQIHAIHSRMFASVMPSKGASQYVVEQALFPANDTAIAYVRRLAKNRGETVEPGKPGSFDELALLVLVRRDADWWLVAAQHVPDRRDVYVIPGPFTTKLESKGDSPTSDDP